MPAQISLCSPGSTMIDVPCVSTFWVDWGNAKAAASAIANASRCDMCLLNKYRTSH
jgi:hypothetical protein